MLKPKANTSKPNDKQDEHTSSGATNSKQNADSITVVPDESHTVPQMSSPIPLLTPDFVLNVENIVPFLENSTNFLVVGIIGSQNVGKSSLLNLVIDETATLTGSIKENEIFKTRNSSSNYPTINPITGGVNIYITKDRVILLDCEPFLANFQYHEYILYELDELKLLVFLLNICHLVIVAQDVTVNPSLIRLLTCAELMRKVVHKQSKETDHCSNIMFVHNKVSKRDLEERQRTVMKNVYKKIFNTSQLNIYSSSTLKKGGGSEKFINYVTFPNIDNFSLEDKYELAQLKECIRNFKYKVRMTKNETMGGQLAGQFNEKQWLQMVLKSWESNANNFFLKKYLSLKDKFNLLNHVVINDRNVYYPDE